jgi:hypothetical protein
VQSKYAAIEGEIVTEAVTAVLDAWAAVQKSRPNVRPQLTGNSGGVRYNLATVLDELQRAYDAQNSAAVAAAELPKRLAEIGWLLEPTKPGRLLRASKVVNGGRTVTRSSNDAEGLLEICRLYEDGQR